MNIRGIGYEDWWHMELAQNNVQWQAFIWQYCPFYYNYCFSRIFTV